MQVFVPFPSPIEVAKCLDKKRLNKQVIESRQILNAIDGTSNGWKNHPIVKMYKGNTNWLSNYTRTLFYYGHGKKLLARLYSDQADKYFRPSFLTEEFCNQHKRRLFTKSPSLYPQFEVFGTSEENWYILDGKLVKYQNGKRLKMD